MAQIQGSLEAARLHLVADFHDDSVPTALAGLACHRIRALGAADLAEAVVLVLRGTGECLVSEALGDLARRIRRYVGLNDEATRTVEQKFLAGLKGDGLGGCIVRVDYV